MSSNNFFNGKSKYNKNFINRAPGSERRSATTSNSHLTPIASNLQRTRNNSGELSLAPGSNRPYSMQRSSNDSTPNISTKPSPNLELSFPILRFDQRAYDLAPGSNRPSSNSFLGPHNSNIAGCSSLAPGSNRPSSNSFLGPHNSNNAGCSSLAPGSNRPSSNSFLGPHNSNIAGCSSRQVEPFNNMALISKKKPIVLNPNESKTFDTYNNGEFALSQCQDYNNSFYDRCVDNQRLRITCDHRIIKFSKHVRNVPHSLCVGSTQARGVVKRPSVLANYESCRQVATQMMSAVSNEERRTRVRLTNELARARSSVCDYLEKYSNLNETLKYNVLHVEYEIKTYFQKNIETLERREKELLKYLEEQKNKQFRTLTVKIQDFHEYNLKITQLTDALTGIQNSNNLEEMNKVNESVRKEIRSLNYKMNSIIHFNSLAVVFEEADASVHHNMAVLGFLKTKVTETTNRVVMQDLCRKGRPILGAPYLIRITPPSKIVTIGDQNLCRPWGACCDHNGIIYVADRSNNRISLFERNGKFMYSFGQEGSIPGEFNRPSGIAIDLMGRLIVADKDNHRIQILTTDGKVIKIIGGLGISSEDGQFYYPWDVAVNMQGDFVVSDSRNRRIQLFDLHGNFKGKFCFDTIFSVRKPKGEPAPRSVCFTPNGDILVTDFYNLCVVAVTQDLKRYQVLQFEKQFSRPQGIACDDFGNIVVSDSRENKIKVFRHTGQHVFTAGGTGVRPGEFDRANGLCITPEGRIMVADLGNNRLVLF